MYINTISTFSPVWWLSWRFGAVCPDSRCVLSTWEDYDQEPVKQIVLDFKRISAMGQPV